MQAVLEIESLPSAALDASARFASHWLPSIREHLASGENLVVVLPEAAYDHRDWRRAAARDLAREYTPVRVNIVARGGDGALEETVSFLEDAPGVTGQYLPLASDGAND